MGENEHSQVEGDVTQTVTKIDGRGYEIGKFEQTSYLNDPLSHKEHFIIHGSSIQKCTNLHAKNSHWFTNHDDTKA